MSGRRLLRRSDLDEDQLALVRLAYRKKFILLAVPMGFGKTVITLTVVRQLLDEFVVRKVLIVAPKRVATDTWPDEIKAWEHTRPLSVSVITGTPNERLSALRTPAEIYIINRENLPWLWRTIGGLDRWPFDMLVYDEASRLKGGKKRTESRRMSEFGVLARARSKMRRVIELSGTPAPKGLIDLWGPAYILDHGERLGSNRKAFLARWFYQEGKHRPFIPFTHSEREILAQLSDVMVSVPPRQTDGIEVRISPVFVRLPKKVMEEYRRFERTLVSAEYDVEAASRGVLANKLLQFANGGLYRGNEEDPEAKEVVPVHDAKLDALESIIEEAAGNNILVAYGYQFDRERIKKRFPRAVLFDEDPNFVKNWNEGRISLGLLHPASAGHGLNLQFGGHIAVWYGLTWSLELWLQFNQRLPRRGQKSPVVHIYPIVARDTADERVLAVLREREVTQDRIIDALLLE